MNNIKVSAWAILICSILGTVFILQKINAKTIQCTGSNTNGSYYSTNNKCTQFYSGTGMTSQNIALLTKATTGSTILFLYLYEEDEGHEKSCYDHGSSPFSPLKSWSISAAERITALGDNVQGWYATTTNNLILQPDKYYSICIGSSSYAVGATAVSETCIEDVNNGDTTGGGINWDLRGYNECGGVYTDLAKKWATIYFKISDEPLSDLYYKFPLEGSTVIGNTVWTELACSFGSTVHQCIENGLGDLVCGTNSICPSPPLTYAGTISQGLPLTMGTNWLTASSSLGEVAGVSFQGIYNSGGIIQNAGYNFLRLDHPPSQESYPLYTLDSATTTFQFYFDTTSQDNQIAIVRTDSTFTTDTGVFYNKYIYDISTREQKRFNVDLPILDGQTTYWQAQLNGLHSGNDFYLNFIVHGDSSLDPTPPPPNITADTTRRTAWTCPWYLGFDPCKIFWAMKEVLVQDLQNVFGSIWSTIAIKPPFKYVQQQYDQWEALQTYEATTTPTFLYQYDGQTLLNISATSTMTTVWQSEEWNNFRPYINFILYALFALWLVFRFIL